MSLWMNDFNMLDQIPTFEETGKMINIEKMKNFAENYTKEALTLAEKKGGSLSKTDFLDIEKSLKEN